MRQVSDWRWMARRLANSRVTEPKRLVWIGDLALCRLEPKTRALSRRVKVVSRANKNCDTALVLDRRTAHQSEPKLNWWNGCKVGCWPYAALVEMLSGQQPR